MKRCQLWIRLAVAGLVLCVGASAWAEGNAEERVFVGADIGGVGALSPMRDFSKAGGMVSPFAGYLWNEYLGALVQLHAAGVTTKSNPAVKFQSDVTWILGATVGPRLSLPLGDWELYGTCQTGVFSGAAPHTPVRRTSWGISGGTGMNYRFSDSFWLGGWWRLNWLDQQVYHSNKVQYASGGFSLTFLFPATKLSGAPSATDPK